MKKKSSLIIDEIPMRVKIAAGIYQVRRLLNPWGITIIFLFVFSPFVLLLNESQDFSLKSILAFSLYCSLVTLSTFLVVLIMSFQNPRMTTKYLVFKINRAKKLKKVIDKNPRYHDDRENYYKKIENSIERHSGMLDKIHQNHDLGVTA